MATIHQAFNYSITSGPSKYDLMLALFDATSDRSRPVIFQSTGGPAGKGPYTVHISSVEREDGSGESWNVRGQWFSHADQTAYAVAGYYSTKRRTGNLSFMRQ